MNHPSRAARTNDRLLRESKITCFLIGRVVRRVYEFTRACVIPRERREQEQERERRGSARVLGEFPSSPGTPPSICRLSLLPLLHLRAAAAFTFIRGYPPPGTTTDELLTPELDPHRAKRQPKSRE